MTLFKSKDTRDHFMKILQQSNELSINDFAHNQALMLDLLEEYSSKLHEFLEANMVQTSMTEEVQDILWNDYSEL